MAGLLLNHIKMKKITTENLKTIWHLVDTLQTISFIFSSMPTWNVLLFLFSSWDNTGYM